MLEKWQFNVLFVVGVGGLLFLLVGPSVGLNVEVGPTAAGGVAAILTYILTQKDAIVRRNKDDPKPKNEERNSNPEGGNTHE